MHQTRPWVVSTRSPRREHSREREGSHAIDATRQRHSRRIDGVYQRRSFKCSDQVSWGVVPDEASCDIPEPSFGEDDVVFDCSSLPDSSIVEGAKVGARVDIKISRRVRGRSPRSEWPQNQKINHPRPRLMETSRVDGVKAPQHRGTPTLDSHAGRRALWADGLLV